jgi:hypothetical protein
VKNPSTGKVLKPLGPTVEFLTSPEDPQNDFCVIRGTLPLGVSVPLHPHADTEDFLVISGELEGLRQDSQRSTWIKVKATDYIHVPSNARNVSGAPAVILIITTKELGQFLEEVGRPQTSIPLPVTHEDLERYAVVSARYGYWIASPEENALVGIHTSS